VEGRCAGGQSLHKAVRWFAWYWRNRFYKSDPSRPIRLSAQTIIRLFYRWKSEGRTPGAVALRYRSSLQKLAPGDVIELARRCLAPGARSFSGTWRELPNPRASSSAFSYATQPALRERLAALFAARRALKREERAAGEAVEKFAEGFAK
jgi:hypothetical protein